VKSPGTTGLPSADRAGNAAGAPADEGGGLQADTRESEGRPFAVGPGVVSRRGVNHHHPPMDVEALYRRFARPTFAFFLRRVGNPETAADLNQEVYLRVSRSIGTFEGRSSWRTWIFVIARNVLAENRVLRWSRLAEHSVTLDAAALARDLGPPATADSSAARVLLRQRLRSCLRRLDDVARAVILDHYFSGLTLRELTERLDLTNASGARAVLLGAQRKLRRCLEHWGRE